MRPKTRDKILRSRLLPLILIPVRSRIAIVTSVRYLAKVLTWLFKSREFANYSYRLTGNNRAQLVGFVSVVTQCPAEEIETYFDELEDDDHLRKRIDVELRRNKRRREFDSEISYGRRLGWYAIIRALEPSIVVETGTEKGLGSVVIAEALLRNGSGRFITIDIEESSGLIFKEASRYDSVIQRVIGDSVEQIRLLSMPVDLFIHDSDHSAEHEREELLAVARLMSPGGVVLSDNSHVTPELAEWSRANDRQFLFFREEPESHWYPGAGIGCAWSFK